SITTRGRKLKDLLLHKSHEDSTVQHDRNPEDVKTIKDHSENGGEYDSLEESHKLKKSTTENDLVYKIEWTPEKIEWSVDGKVLRTLRPKDLAKFKKTLPSGQKQQLEIPSQPMQIQLTIWDAGHDKGTTAWAGGVTDYGENDEREYVARVDWIEVACYDNKEAKRNPWPGKDASARLAQVEAEERKAEEEKEARLKAEAKKDKKAQKAIDAAIAAKDASSSGILGGWLSFGRRGNGSAEFTTTTTTSNTDNAEPKSKKLLKQEEKQRKKQKQAAEKLKEKEKKARTKEPGVMSRFLDTLIRRLLRLNFVVLFLVAAGTYLTEPANARKFHLVSKEKAGLQQ
ncbi:hypothetical protein BGW39_008679, partial [Mortierella sp. 14UC]